jgi:FkbM family methyltransferase
MSAIERLDDSLPFGSVADGGKTMPIAKHLGKLLPVSLRTRVKRVRDNVRFRSIGLMTCDYDGPLEFIGTAYGGYVLPKREIRDGSVCYSFGAGEDVSFETGLAAAFPVEVHIFDPTPRAITYARSLVAALSATGGSAGERLHFHPWGVWSSDQQMQFYAPKDPAHVSHSMVNMQHTSDYFVADCRRPKSIMTVLGHKSIDLLKLNIEGAEYEVMRAMFEDKIRPSVICINFDELHTQIDASARGRLRGLVKQFTDHGYVPVAAEACRATFVVC